jgi:NADH:ubiquinone oxidoreductase subunit 6 (subunit J)
LFAKYKEDFQIFGIIDLLKQLFFSFALNVFWKSPNITILLLLGIEISYVVMLIRFKPSATSNILIFTEFGNISLLIYCFIWAIDDNLNFLSQDSRFLIGWLFVGTVMFMICATTLIGIRISFIENKENLKNLLQKVKQFFGRIKIKLKKMFKKKK